eukprot:14816981-Alexandrium_andersonii.AAC.1
MSEARRAKKTIYYAARLSERAATQRGPSRLRQLRRHAANWHQLQGLHRSTCLLYTSPSPRD